MLVRAAALGGTEVVATRTPLLADGIRASAAPPRPRKRRHLGPTGRKARGRCGRARDPAGLSEGVSLQFTNSQAEQISERVAQLLNNGLTGLALVLALLFLFLNTRTAI